MLNALVNYSLFIYFFFSLDQSSKNWFLASDFYVRRNYGVVLGLFPGLWPPRLIYFLSTISIVFFIVAKNWRGSPKFLKYLSSSLLLGGVMGNWFDYLLRGYVIDFINLGWFLPFWPLTWVSYFNLADVFIVCGLLIFGLGWASSRLRDPGSGC